MVLNKTNGQFLRQWGIVALDFESQMEIWANHHPKDADVMMLEQAAMMKSIAPDTKIWVYRNLVQPYSNFQLFRQKLEVSFVFEGRDI